MKHILFLIILSLFAPASFAGSIEGYVNKIMDGDTLSVGEDNAKVRLVHIDAPESDQATGRSSKEALTALVKGKSIHVDIVGKDIYGRYLGEVYVDKLYVNKELVRKGWAFRDRLHSKEFRTDEEEAKKEKLGIWKNETMPPWIWRLEKKIRQLQKQRDALLKETSD